MCINQCLKSNPIVLAPDRLLKEAIALLAFGNDSQQNQAIGCIFVVEEKLTGIITKSDVVRAMAAGVDLETTTVDAIATQPVITLTQEQCQDIQTVWSLLQKHSISHLPVVTEDGELIGAIEAKDLLQFLPSKSDKLEVVEGDRQQQQGQEKLGFLKRFFEVTPSMLCIAGFDGYFKRINPTFIETLGFSERELLTVPFINFVHPEDRAATIAEVDKLSRGQTTISWENRYRTKNGGYRWLLWTAKAYLSEKIICAAAQDITERKQTEQALRESEERWLLALKGANDGIWDWNFRTNEVFFSRRWKEMLGFTEDDVDNTLEEWSKRVHPDDLDRVNELIQAHFTQKTPFYSSEHRMLCKDGSYKWILDRGQALWDKAGNVIRMAGSHTDISEYRAALSERQEAEEKAIESENLLRTIVESEPEWVKLLDRHGNLLEINPAGLATIEADSLMDMLGRSLYSLINANHRQAFIDLTEGVFAGKSGRLEFELTSLKGKPRWLSTHAVPLKDGDRIIAMLAVTRDISERKQAEIQLQQERDFSNAIINTVGALVAVLNRDGAIVNFNHTCEQITGYSSREVIGRQVWEFLIAPEEKEPVKAVFQRLLAGQVPNQYEHFWVAKDGSRHLISWSNTALFDAEGKVEFIITTGIDVSEQRRVWNRLEQQYQQTNLLAEITRKIRMSTKLEDILQTAVTEVQQLLACDRALIVEIKNNHTALPISESILPDLRPMLGYELADPLLVGEYLARYRRGKVLAIDNIATAPISPDIQQLLQQFQVRAKLVVPILSQNELKGLLVIHQCDRLRQWQTSEIELLTQLADRIGVALSQAQLLNNLEELVSVRTSELMTSNSLLQTEIAERKQTEIALRENQEKLSGILDNADEAIISIDDRQQIQLFNQGAEQIFGYQADEVIGQPLDVLLLEVFRQRHRHHVRQFGKSPPQSRRMAEGNTNVFGLRQDGREFPAKATVAKLQTRQGTMYTVMLKDMTEKYQAQEKLQISQCLLAKAEKIAKIGSWEYNMTTGQLTWSEELFEILSFANSSIPNCEAIFAQIHPEDRLLVQKALRQGHTEGKTWQFNYRWLLTDGTVKYLESRGEPTVDERGNVLKVWGTIMDITQRIQAEKSLQRSEQKLRLITDGLPVLIAYVDDRQRYLYNNRTYETWYGKSCSSLLGQPMQTLIGNTNYQKMLPYIETALAGTAVTFENQYLENDKSYWLNATFVPDFDSNGRVKGFFSMIDDISDRKAVEQMKSEFVSIASHEMRTPLTSIHGVLELLKAERLAELSPSGKTMVDMASRNSERLVRLVNDILDLERMDSGRDRIEKQLCNSTDVIQQAVDTLRSIADEAQISLETVARSIKFQADRDRIIQTLTNLIGNAIKFSPADSQVEIACQLQNQNVLFTVKDWGRGIPPDKLETIFERFEQVDASDSRKKGGTGLGLAICRHITLLHNGKIWAESVSGEGSTFYFSLPQE